MGGVTFQATHGLDALAESELILVPGWRDAPVPEALTSALCAAHAKGARVASICSGVFVLAAAGLLDDKPATTHWRHIAALARKYPAIKVDPDVLYVDGGDVLTSAGSAVSVSSCNHLCHKCVAVG